jgi:hypothetical protein
MKLPFTSLLLILTYHGAFAQGYEGRPCSSKSFAKELLIKKELKQNIFIGVCDPDQGQAASSFLKASGKAPAKGIAGDPDGDYGYDVWTCMYSGYSAVDGNSATAWVEGAEGHGKGELLVITRLDLSKKIEILSGFGKSQSLFVANSRPKTINIHIVRALPQAGGQSQCGDNYEALKIISTSKVILKDINQFQPLPIPPFKKETYLFQDEQWDYQYWLMIEIIDVYPGTKYQDTCISEIRNVK